MSAKTNHKNSVPILINIPVYRGAYLTQERTDALCELLWNKRSEFVVNISNELQYGFPDCRIGNFRKYICDVQIFYRNEEKADSVEPISFIQMVDLCYEIDRRIRSAANAEEIPIFGKQIAPSPEGPYPDWPKCKKSRYSVEGMTQALSDELSSKVYDYFVQNEPEVLFAEAENHRRQMQEGETSNIIRKVSEELTSSRYRLPTDAAFIEFGSRFYQLYKDTQVDEGNGHD